MRSFMTSLLASGVSLGGLLLASGVGCVATVPPGGVDAAAADAGPASDGALDTGASPSDSGAPPPDASVSAGCAACRADRCSPDAADCASDPLCAAVVECWRTCDGTAGCRTACAEGDSALLARAYALDRCQGLCRLPCGPPRSDGRTCSEIATECDALAPDYACCGTRSSTCIGGRCAVSEGGTCVEITDCAGSLRCTDGRCVDRCSAAEESCIPGSTECCAGLLCQDLMCCNPSGAPVPPERVGSPYYCCSHATVTTAEGTRCM